MAFLKHLPQRKARQRRVERRQQLGVWVAGGEVTAAWWDEWRCGDRQRRLLADPGAAASGRADQPAPPQFAYRFKPSTGYAFP